MHITEAEEDVQGTQAAVAALQDLRYTSESGEGGHLPATSEPVPRERAEGMNV